MYFDFFVESAVDLGDRLGLELQPWTLAIVLPVGISSYAFQTISYAFDVFSRRIEPDALCSRSLADAWEYLVGTDSFRGFSLPRSDFWCSGVVLVGEIDLLRHRGPVRWGTVVGLMLAALIVWSGGEEEPSSTSSTDVHLGVGPSGRVPTRNRAHCHPWTASWSTSTICTTWFMPTATCRAVRLGPRCSE